MANPSLLPPPPHRSHRAQPATTSLFGAPTESQASPLPQQTEQQVAMARRQGAVALAVLAAVLVGACLPGAVSAKKKQHMLLSSLPWALLVDSSAKAGHVLHAGKDTMTVTWSRNTTAPVAPDAAYKNVKVELCYAPASRKDRGWRKAEDDLSKDKACQFKVTEQAYAAAGGRVEYLVARDIPTGSYFLRAYVLDASETYVAYGQTSPDAAFDVAGITGITTSIQIAAGVFSAFSVVSLAFFFVAEKRKKDK